MIGAAARALEYLASHRVMTLATHGDEGPWAAAVFYANVGFDLYFLSSPGSRHGLNLAALPAAAAAVHEDYADWRAIKGVQLEGLVEELSGAGAQRAQALYGEKFDFAVRSKTTPAPIAAALERVRWYRLAASRAYFIDNAVGFGHRDRVL